MAFSIKKTVRLPKSSDGLLNYVKDHHVRLEDVAQNLCDKRHPNGYHARWLRTLIHRGLSSHDERSVKLVADKLSHQKQVKGQISNAQ